MVATVSTDEQTWLTQINGHEGFGYLRCTAEPIAGGAWYRAVLCAEVTTPEYFEGVDPWPLDFTSVAVGEVAGDFPAITGSNYLLPSWEFRATTGALTSAFDELLMDGGQGSPDAVFSGGACLFYDPTSIEHDYHTTDNHGWVRDADSQAFNLWALREMAVYERVQSLFPDKDAFFAEAYGSLSAYDVEIGITLIAVQGAVTPSNATPSSPPSLNRYPTQAPKIGMSSRASIRFTGTGSGADFMFVPPGSQVPIQVVAGGQNAVFPAAGYRPNMQIALSSATTPERFELPLQWKSFGKIKFTVPLAAQGFYDVTHYRHQVMTPGGPSWSAWYAIPSLQQAHVFVP